jgi:thiol-disulfide isomerase/thioredoxin
MRKIITCAAIGVLPIFAFAQLKQHKFVLDGKIVADTLSTGKIYMDYTDHGVNRRDSAELKNNTYHFEGSISDEAVTTNLFWHEVRNGIKVNKSFKGFVQFYNVPGHISLLHHKGFNQFQITGSPVQDDLNRVNQMLKARTQPEDVIKKDYIKSHPNSWLSFVFLEKIVRAKQISFAEGTALYTGLSTELKQYEQVKDIHKILSSYQTVAIGKKAMDFTANDVNGKAVSLSSFKGKYILVDFWASWCHPCRAENPVMVKAYQKYKSKDFDILGVSLDGNKKAWLAAIKQDGVAWGQVSNLQAFNDKIAMQYGITSIPRNFLIDPDGKIVAMDLRGEKLEEKLAEVFK